MPKNFRSRTSWREKLERTDHSRIVEIPAAMAKRLGTGTMLIPKPLDVDALIRKTRKGNLVTVSEIRSRLARDNNVEVACPLTTGHIHSHCCGNRRRRLADRTKARDALLASDKRRRQLEREVSRRRESAIAALEGRGHTIAPGKGKKPPRVRNFETSLARL